MKHWILILSALAFASGVLAQHAVPHDHDGDGVPDHASHDDHEGHDHGEAAAVPHDHDGDGVSDHASHDDHEGDDQDSHDGHDHADHDGHDHDDHDATGVQLTPGFEAKAGIEVHEAVGGVVSKMSVLPAEIKLNRDTTAAVSPRFPSVVRQVFVEIGDEVRKGDKLASLENRETLAVYTVEAPHDGVVITKDLAKGEVVGDDKVLFEVADLATVWADISVFPRYLHILRKGADVTFVAHDGHTARGLIKYISPIVNHETRTFTARCVLEGADEDFTPGAFVRAEIVVAEVDAKVVVRREAVQTIEGETVVFIPSPEGYITAPVLLGLADTMNVEIKQGLVPGQEYVAAGAFSLKAELVTSGMDPHAGHGH